MVETDVAASDLEQAEKISLIWLGGEFQEVPVQICCERLLTKPLITEEREKPSVVQVDKATLERKIRRARQNEKP